MTTDSPGLWCPPSAHNPAGLTEDERAVLAEMLTYFKNYWRGHELDVLRYKAELLERIEIKTGVAGESY